MLNDLKSLVSKLGDEEAFLLGGPEHNMNFAPFLLQGCYSLMESQTDKFDPDFTQWVEQYFLQIKDKRARE
jgi:hypothetical protein